MKTIHRLATLMLLTVMSLVTLGGIVHNTGSSLACPDWPLCFGQVMPKMEGAVAIEHSHRLLGAFVGFCAILLVFFTSRVRDKRPKLFKFACVTLGVIIFQGVLGGITVLLQLSPLVSTAHLATSQIVVALICYQFLKSRETGSTPHLPAPTSEVQKNKILQGLKWAAAAVYIQMCLGAFIRHGGQSVACGLGWDSAWLCLDGASPTGTLFPATLEARIHMLHRFMAVASLLVVVFGTRPFLHWARAQQLPKIRILIIFCHVLFAVQIALGVYTIATGISFYVVTAHLFTGMLIWINIFTQNMLARELLTPETDERVSLSSLQKSYQS